MNYLRSFVGAGGEEGGGENISAIDTVEKLLERVQTALLLEDRRDALKALKSLAKKYRLEVGGQGMQILVETLQREKGNAEIVGLALETLCSIIGEDDEGPSENSEDDLGERFAEIFLKKTEQVSLVLSMLEDYEFIIRRPALRLLTGLLRHRSQELQDILLTDPSAIPRLMDLLQERREVLRNDAVLMLCELTRGNVHIQKLVAFENAFQLLLDIITYEGDRSIVVEDCLYVVLNLLKNNPSNQQLFREHSLIQHLQQLLHQLLASENEDESLPNGVQNNKERAEDTEWSPQKTANVHLLFQVIRSLVAPSNSSSITQAAQKIMFQCGMLNELSDVLLESGVPAEVLTEAIRAVGEVIRGNKSNQEHFASIMAPSEPPKPVILVLLLSMTNEKQPFALRIAAIYCFQCYLHGNRNGKQEIIQTLLPSSAQVTDITAGHVLCTGLLSPDGLLVWLSSVSLMHCLFDDSSLKEQLLRVQLATSLGDAPVSLLHKVCSVLTLQGGRKAQVRAGLLMLLSAWLVDCPVAVSHFLQMDDTIAYLCSQAAGGGASEASEETEALLQGLCSFLLGLCVIYNDDSAEKVNRAALLQIYDRRVGRDVIVEKLEAVSRSEHYVRAAQRPNPVAKSPSELLLDWEFTKLFKATEGDLIKSLRPSDSNGNTNGTTRPHTVEQHESIVVSYKELIKRQDAQISDLTSQVKRLQENLSQPTTNGNDPQAQINGNSESTIERLEKELAEKCTMLDQKDLQLKQWEAYSQSQSQNTPAPVPETSEEKPSSENIPLVEENATLKSQVEYYSGMLQQKQNEAVWYYQQCEQWRAYQTGQVPDENQVVATLTAQLKEMEQQLSYGWQAFEAQSSQLTAAVSEKAVTEEKLKIVEAEKAEAVKKMALAVETEHSRVQELETILKEKSDSGQKQNGALESVETELLATKKEQEDLLVLLADQDQKIRDYRRRLVQMGQPVSDDEDEDEEEEIDVGSHR